MKKTLCARPRCLRGATIAELLTVLAIAVVFVAFLIYAHQFLFKN